MEEENYPSIGKLFGVKLGIWVKGKKGSGKLLKRGEILMLVGWKEIEEITDESGREVLGEERCIRYSVLKGEEVWEDNLCLLSEWDVIFEEIETRG